MNKVQQTHDSSVIGIGKCVSWISFLQADSQTTSFLFYLNSNGENLKWLDENYMSGNMLRLLRNICPRSRVVKTRAFSSSEYFDFDK